MAFFLLKNTFDEVKGTIKLRNKKEE